MIDLGTFGGSDGWGRGISDSGQVVGYAANAAGNYRPFLWTEETGMQDLNALIPQLRLDTVGAYAINGSGKSLNRSQPSGNYDAFLLTPVPNLHLILLGMGAVGILGFACIA